MLFPGFGSLKGGVAKALDPGGFMVEKVAPKPLKPLTGLHGTNEAFNVKDPEPQRSASLLKE